MFNIFKRKQKIFKLVGPELERIAAALETIAKNTTRQDPAAIKDQTIRDRIKLYDGAEIAERKWQANLGERLDEAV